MERRNTYMPTRLPVYRVVTTGIQETEAHRLAEALRIPAKGLRWLDGEASFVNRDKYLAVPSVPIKDPDIVARSPRPLRTTTRRSRSPLPASTTQPLTGTCRSPTAWR
jgi:hypothetical protein